MEQLKMYWLPGTELNPIELPEGCTIVNYRDETDRTVWCECCKDGLIPDDADESEYVRLIENVKGIRQTEDVFFLDFEGEHVGTITAYYNPVTRIGTAHMLGIRTAFRGRGYAKLLMRTALHHLAEQDIRYILLTTDDWRKNAIRNYLHEGYLPVEYELGMQDRWEILLEELDIEETQMVYEDATPFRTIRRRSKAQRVRFGVLGAGRGKSMMEYCRKTGHAELVAVCDKSAERLAEAKKEFGDGIAYYSDFEEFVKHDMDCVVLANYANEHAPFAIRCMEEGKHVLSEVLPVQTLKEGVELIEAVERTGKIYSYAENYCYMPAVKKMKKYYLGGALGTFEYGEGEYMHNCEPEWHRLTWADPNHWRNTMSAFFYCTHSIGPLLHVTGLRPVRVTGFEGPYNARMARMGAKAAPYGVEMITLENGAVIKSLHGVGPARSSIWFSVYGSKGRMESAREDAMHGYVTTLYTNCDSREGCNWWCPGENDLSDGISEAANGFGHGSADYYIMYHMVQKIRGNRNADTVDVYEAMDMFLPGMFAYRSVLNGGIPMEIPDFRDPAVRERYRNDTMCTDSAAAGDSLVPSYSKGNPEIPQETYDYLASIPENEENNEAYRKKRSASEK